MDEAILLNPSFIKKTSSEDDGLSLGQGSSKSYQSWSSVIYESIYIQSPKYIIY